MWRQKLANAMVVSAMSIDGIIGGGNAVDLHFGLGAPS